MPPPTRGWVPANIQPDAICITTNGFVKKNGEAVMGKGCAKHAAHLMPGLPEALGNALNAQGNQVYAHGPYAIAEVGYGVEIVTFPVKGVREPCNPDKGNVVQHMQKHFKPGQIVPGWACKARIHTIRKSCLQLATMAYERNWQVVVLPRPGCGAGELNWTNVRHHMSTYLDDRFYVITF